MENLELTQEKSTCLCGGADYVVLACSGACDLGQITDLGYKKGQTPVTELEINEVYDKI